MFSKGTQTDYIFTVSVKSTEDFVNSVKVISKFTS